MSNKIKVAELIGTTMAVMGGPAEYLYSIKENSDGFWANDGLNTKDGYWVRHESDMHHVFFLGKKNESDGTPEGEGWKAVEKEKKAMNKKPKKASDMTDAELLLEIKREEEKILERNRIEEISLKMKGFKYFVDYFIHTNSGDDIHGRTYFNIEPDRFDIAKLLKRSVVKTDYVVGTL